MSKPESGDAPASEDLTSDRVVEAPAEGPADPAPAMPTFRIGLVMAGAVSAGAYTAGVMDFLLEALGAIEDARAGRSTEYLKAGLPGETEIVAPPYRVEIGAMSGTSAGAMVTAITTTVLNTRIPPVTGPTTPGVSTGNPLYDCWVDQIHIDRLLDTGDLARGKPLRSILNSEPLDDITRGALAYAAMPYEPRAYLAEVLPIYLCVGNMRGIAYSLELAGSDGAGSHDMLLHADHLTFELAQPGAAASQDKERARLEGQGVAAGKRANWQLLGDTCLASGAFPIGLAPRLLDRSYDDYFNRQWFIPGTVSGMKRVKDEKGNDLDPVDSPASWLFDNGGLENLNPLYESKSFPDARYKFVCVDGGIFNNEPLELCRRALAGHGRNPRNPREANAAVVMIDPFPDHVSDPNTFDAKQMGSLLGVAQRLFGVLIAQSRFKLDELALAHRGDVASRFAILPSRRDPTTDEPLQPAIACGSLNAFGGFLSREFRHHDFMLGRRNCQKFLMTAFVLPAQEDYCNPIVRPWLSDPKHQAFILKQHLKINDRRVDALPIIPLLGKLASPQYTAMPPWPQTPADLDLDSLSKKIRTRLDAVIPRLRDALSLPCSFQMAATAAYWFGKKKLTKSILGKIEDSLAANGIRPKQR